MGIVIKFNGPKEVEGTYGTFANCRGQGRVTLRFERNEHGNGFELHFDVSEQTLPPEQREAVKVAIEEYAATMSEQLSFVRVTVVSAVVHSIDNSPWLFRVAATLAMKEACDWAK